MATAALIRHDYVVCPWCGKDSGHMVDHLYETQHTTFGPWYCGECRRGYSGRVIEPGIVEIQREENLIPSRSMVLLKLQSEDGPVYFVMDHDRCHGSGNETDEDNQSHQRYYFEEHSCPTNWLKKCVAVIKSGDADPHGVLTFVRAVDVPDDFDECNDDNWSSLFPECFADLTIEGSVSYPELEESGQWLTHKPNRLTNSPI